MIEETVACPDCSTGVGVDPAWPMWCEACGWNVDPDPPPEPTRPRAAVRLAAARLQVLETYDEVMSSRGDLHPRWDRPVVRCTAIALAVHLVSLSVLAACCWWLWVVWPRPIGVALALVGVVIAWGFRPRLGRVSRKAVRLGRADAPHLYGLLDQLSTTLSAGRVHTVVVTMDVNASFGKIGFGRRRLLVLGLPLWEALGPSGSVALLAHELAHDVNRDVRRTFLAATSIGTLREWRLLLDHRRGLSGRYGSGMPFVDGGEALAHGMTAALGRAVGAVLRLQLRVTSQAHQRAEFLADELAARAAGTRSMVELLNVLLCRDRAEPRRARVTVARRG